jgi:Ca-activated chloride channel family protein
MSRRLFVIPLLCVIWTLCSIAPRGQAPGAPAAAGVTILGSVVDASLKPIAGVMVTLEQNGRTVATTKSGADGAFRFAGVAPGAYRVRAERATFPVLTRDVQVPSGTAAMRLPLVLMRAEDRAADSKTAGVAGGAAGPVPTPAAAPPPPATVGGVVGGVAQGQAGGAGGGRGGRGGGFSTTRTVAEMAIDAAAQYPGAPGYPDRRDEPWSGYRYPHTGERYAHVVPNRFQSTFDRPLSTFGADVDTASYTNVRRFLTEGQLPPEAAVRVEEFVNYFKFDYATPRGNRPIAITTEVGDAPWAPSHKLVLIGAKAATPPVREITGRNIVLLLDVSGSMAPIERLPLIKTALGQFVDTLRPDDRLAIVTYAGWSGVALPSTPARRRGEIHEAIDRLNAGGSTNGAQGLVTAYRVAREAFIPGGVNRVILATDGDFNVGVTSQRDLLQLIERERESGVFLSVFGVGSGNLKDSTMEMLADKGNGHYAYLDSLQEARRVLIQEGDATLETVAKDVKFQVEFNPAMVAAWKLIGYENRLMASQDFNDDRKDGGEMGAGHTVTVLYEVIPVGVAMSDDRDGRPAVDPLRYQGGVDDTRRPAAQRDAVNRFPGEWLTVKTRYKAPEGEESELMTQPVSGGTRIQHLPIASAIAEFGLLLQSGSRDRARWDALVERTRRLQVPAAMRADFGGFTELVDMARRLVR